VNPKKESTVNLSELPTAQTKAGARYRAATEELHTALIDLGAIDAALQSGAVVYDDRAHIRTFSICRKL
jgi:hypothetical protein